MPNPTTSQLGAWYGSLSSGNGLIQDAFGNNVAVGAKMTGAAASGSVLTSDASGNLTLQATGTQTAYAPAGLTGATAASRYAGATTSGSPGSGTFAKGDFVIDQTGTIWICTTAGSPGTWVQMVPASGATMTGTLTTAAGTATVAPLAFQSGTVLTTAAAGDAEFDGTAFYLTAAASSRQVVDTEQVQVLSSPYTLANDTNAHPLLNATAAGAVTLQSSTSYEFDSLFSITGLSGSSHQVAFGIAGGASFTSLMYQATAAAGAAITAGNVTIVSVTTATNILSANTNVNCNAQVRGVLRVNNGGTVIPQITQVTASAAATVATNSYFRCCPIGSNTVTNVGDWS